MESQEQTNPGGRPTAYRKAFDEQVFKLCLLGATDKELADFFDVAESTINLWKQKHTGFSESVKRGKIQADANVAESFYKRATGYEYTETTYEKIDSLAGLELTDKEAMAIEAYKKKVVVKQLPPDTGAGMNWLKNRRKQDWRDSQHIDHTTKGESINAMPDLSQLTDEELEDLIAIQEKLAAAK